MAQITDKMLNDLGLTLESVFVPYSKSRNFKDGAFMNEKSLNWKVTLKYNGFDVITTDYSAGIGHCPSYKNYDAKIHGMRLSMLHATFLEHEIEKGTACDGWAAEWGGKGRKAILPEFPSVLYSLISDAETIDYPTYEDWADVYGYDRDSRKGETLYRMCLEMALKIRARLGDTLLAQLREMFQDF
jgi:hypothetical protein